MVHLTNGESAWGLTEQILAGIFDATQAGNWQRGGGKGQRPKPLDRPGVTDTEVETFGGGATYSIDEMRDLIARHSRGAV